MTCHGKVNLQLLGKTRGLGCLPSMRSPGEWKSYWFKCEKSHNSGTVLDIDSKEIGKSEPYREVDI